MHRVEVTGDINTLRFPAMCASCGAPPAGVLPLSKLFRRTHKISSGRTQYLYPQVSVPFCRACVAAHEEARRPPEPRVLRRLRNRWLLSSVPYLLPILALLWLASELAPQALKAVASRTTPDLLIWGGILVVIAAGVWGLARKVLAGRRALVADYDRGPDDRYPENPNAYYVEFARGPLGINCVLPGAPTTTLASVDFADETFEVAASNHRSFSFANQEVADAFADANADRIWDPNSPHAVRSRWVKYVLFALVVAIVLFFFVSDMMGR